MPSLLDPGVSIYVALAVALVTWLVLFVYIWRLDAQARELRRRLDSAARPVERPAEPQATLSRQQVAGNGRSGS